MPEPVEKPVLCCCFTKKKPTEMETLTKQNNLESSVEMAKVPFSADLPKDLTVGKTICIEGYILPKCSRFAVNLTCGRSLSSDIAFHLNPRILQKYVVRNSHINGHWGKEEKTTTITFPFKRNEKFLLNIFIGNEEFYVAVNGEHLCTFKFRITWEKVTGLNVQGDVDVCGVEYKQLEKYPEVVDLTPEVRIAEGLKENFNTTLKTGMKTPVTFSLPGGFQKNFQLEIYGRVKILPHSFFINLQDGTQKYPHPNIPLHLNPRFGLGTGDPMFVRNAWLDNGWGQEERTPGFQFKPGSPFTMAIRKGDEHFSVWIDGKLAGEFKFRGAIDDINTVHIEGDVVIFDVFFNKNID